MGYFGGATNTLNAKLLMGAHPDGTPLGIPANKKTKEARMKAHNGFDKFWQKRGMKRNKAYKWLQKQMSMTKEECHIGRFNIEQCNAVIWVCNHGGNGQLEFKR